MTEKIASAGAPTAPARPRKKAAVAAHALPAAVRSPGGRTARRNAAGALDGEAAERAASKAPLTVSRSELLADGTDRDFRRLVHGLLPFLATHTAIRDGYAALLGLTGPQYTIMLCIRNLGQPDSPSIKTVADHLRLSASFITAETKALERSGLIAKERDEGDRRMVCLSLTPKGEELLDSIADLRQQVNDVEFGCLSNEEFRLLVPLIERLIPSAERALALLHYMSTQIRTR